MNTVYPPLSSYYYNERNNRKLYLYNKFKNLRLRHYRQMNPSLDIE